MKSNKLLKDLLEMTMKAGNLEANLALSFNYIKDLDLSKAQHIGDISEVKILRIINQSDFYDILFNTKLDQPVGFSINKEEFLHNKKFQVILNWYIAPSARRQDLGYKYLYFLKNVLKQVILLGKIHSYPTQEFLKKQFHLKRFQVNWFNEKTGEIDPYLKDHYSKTTDPNDWSIMIEADEHTVFNQFIKGIPHLIENSYDWLFNDIEKL